MPANISRYAREVGTSDPASSQWYLLLHQHHMHPCTTLKNQSGENKPGERVNLMQDALFRIWDMSKYFLKATVPKLLYCFIFSLKTIFWWKSQNGLGIAFLTLSLHTGPGIGIIFCIAIGNGVLLFSFLNCATRCSLIVETGQGDKGALSSRKVFGLVKMQPTCSLIDQHHWV